MYSATLIAHSPGWQGHPELETTGKVLLPSTALNDIYGHSDNSPSVVLFYIMNPKTRLKVYAGVQEFSSPNGQICMPYWMMEFIQINEGDQVRVTTARINTGTSATFQPKDSSFMKLKDTKIVLEHTLRQHPCLTQGTVIPIDFANKRYFLKILKTEPNEGIYTLKADLAVEFAPPETEFTHRWLEPDTDSSDDMNDVKEHTGRTLRGKEVKFTEEKKIMHSTFESREKERMKPGAVEGVRKFEMGQEILPPKPDENTMIAKEKKAEEEKKKYQGVAHTIRHSKSKGGSSDSLADIAKSASQDFNQPAPIAQPEKKQDPMFYGRGRTIGGKVVNIPKPEQPPEEKENDENKKEEKKDQFAFQGLGRTIRGKQIEIKKEEEAPADPNLLYGKKDVPKESEFKGVAHTLKKK